MRILTNEKLIKTRSTWSGRFMMVGFGLIIVSAALSFLSAPTPASILPAYAALFGGFIIFNIGAAASIKWRREPRADQVLEKALKGLDNKYRLYNFLLPAEHVLLMPTGIVVFQVRRLAGVISCVADKWSHRRSFLSRLRFAAEEQVGNPTKDVQQEMALLREFLDKNLETDDSDVPVEGMIVFSHPNVQLTVSNPSVPVFSPKEAKTYLRQAASGEARLSPETYNTLADLFGRAEGEQGGAAADGTDEEEGPSEAQGTDQRPRPRRKRGPVRR